jgi:HEAT repeat protein
MISKRPGQRKTSSSRQKRPTLEDEQRVLAQAMTSPGSAEALEALVAALERGRSLVAARAAHLVQSQAIDLVGGVTGLRVVLVRAFERFLRDPIKTDPSCHAKQAILEALDHGGSVDPEPFLKAVGHVQLEPAWGPPVDTAAGVRARGVVALARIGCSDFEWVVAALLTDPEPPVRQAALEALAHRGERHGAALARFKLRSGDADPLVNLAAMHALVALAPDLALLELEPLISDPQRRELAAIALGQSSRDDALSVLTGALEDNPSAAERAELYRGIGLHRSERALGVLLGIIGAGLRADALAAIEALGARRFDPGVKTRVLEIARGRGPELKAALAKAFPPDGSD